jgi:hypothetical protein
MLSWHLFFYLFDTNAVISNIIYVVVSMPSPSLWSHLAVSVGHVCLIFLQRSPHMRLACVQAATYPGAVPIGLSGALHAVLFTIGFGFSWHGVWHPLAGAPAPTTACATASM